VYKLYSWEEDLRQPLYESTLKLPSKHAVAMARARSTSALSASPLGSPSPQSQSSSLAHSPIRLTKAQQQALENKLELKDLTAKFEGLLSASEKNAAISKRKVRKAQRVYRQANREKKRFEQMSPAQKIVVQLQEEEKKKKSGTCVSLLLLS